ncbi:hypothetical protein JW960_16990 [candidate division KSB1 bacterium]|nr:hypothetical protein [candidate division KSB1 bacterium]
MNLSIHYYVLCLSDDSCKLFEGFRDMLITVENGDFPSIPAHNINARHDMINMKDPIKRFYREVDKALAKYHGKDPLKIVLTGEKTNRSIFSAVTQFNNDIIGVVEGDFNTTSVYDLGQIVWPVIREALSGDRERALREMEDALNNGNIAVGLEDVWHMANLQTGYTLLVEDDYHVRGSIMKTDNAFVISEDVGIMQIFDDVVDAIIEKVLSMAGHVIFIDSGLLIKYQRIALIHR